MQHLASLSNVPYPVLVAFLSPFFNSIHGYRGRIFEPGPIKFQISKLGHRRRELLRCSSSNRNSSARGKNKYFILPALLRPHPSLNHTDDGMIPVTRRATSCSLTVVRNAQGRQVTRVRTGTSGNSIAVAQVGRGRLQQARVFSQTHPRRSALNLALEPNENGDVAKGEGEDEARPEHAVISTFDLFSIGGPYSCFQPCLLKFPDAMSWCSSWSEQLTHRRPHEGWQHIYQRSKRSGAPGTSVHHFMQ